MRKGALTSAGPVPVTWLRWVVHAVTVILPANLLCSHESGPLNWVRLLFSTLPVNCVSATPIGSFLVSQVCAVPESTAKLSLALKLRLPPKVSLVSNLA